MKKHVLSPALVILAALTPSAYSQYSLGQRTVLMNNIGVLSDIPGNYDDTYASEKFSPPISSNRDSAILQTSPCRVTLPFQNSNSMKSNSWLMITTALRI